MPTRGPGGAGAMSRLDRLAPVRAAADGGAHPDATFQQIQPVLSIVVPMYDEQDNVLPLAPGSRPRWPRRPGPGS